MQCRAVWMRLIGRTSKGTAGVLRETQGFELELVLSGGYCCPQPANRVLRASTGKARNDDVPAIPDLSDVEPADPVVSHCDSSFVPRSTDPDEGRKRRKKKRRQLKVTVRLKW